MDELIKVQTGFKICESSENKLVWTCGVIGEREDAYNNKCRRA